MIATSANDFNDVTNPTTTDDGESQESPAAADAKPGIEELPAHEDTISADEIKEALGARCGDKPLLKTIADVVARLDYMEQRERDICKAVGGVSDNGQFREDIITVLKKLTSASAEKPRSRSEVGVAVLEKQNADLVAKNRRLAEALQEQRPAPAPPAPAPSAPTRRRAHPSSALSSRPRPPARPRPRWRSASTSAKLR